MMIKQIQKVVGGLNIMGEITLLLVEDNGQTFVTPPLIEIDPGVYTCPVIPLNGVMVEDVTIEYDKDNKIARMDKCGTTFVVLQEL